MLLKMSSGHIFTKSLSYFSERNWFLPFHGRVEYSAKFENIRHGFYNKFFVFLFHNCLRIFPKVQFPAKLCLFLHYIAGGVSVPPSRWNSFAPEVFTTLRLIPLLLMIPLQILLRLLRRILLPSRLLQILPMCESSLLAYPIA